MKKTFYTFLCIVSSIILALPLQTFAETYIPKSISIGDELEYDAGTSVSLKTVDGNRRIGFQTNLEYGVARIIESDGFTFFEIITNEYRDLVTAPDLSSVIIQIPNITEANATSTYVVYTKFYEKNNPENESFYTTKEFLIKANDKPFVQIAHINLLQSNGKRFSTNHGPTIYDPRDAETVKDVATSTSIEVTFESNQDMVINPYIVFSKIRSNVFSENVSLAPIRITKGKTYAVIPLPTFAYTPGVYFGALSFADKSIKNKIDFQYIVAGDSVSVGNISQTKDGDIDLFTFEIFGTPIDIDRFNATAPASSTAIYSTSTASSSSLFYKTTIDFIDSKGNKVHNIIQDVDFSKTDFSVEIPKDYTDIAQVHVQVVSMSGKVVYEGTKQVNYVRVIDISAQTRRIIYTSLYILLILITVVALYRRYIKTAILCAMIILGMFLTRDAFALNLAPYITFQKRLYNHPDYSGTMQNPTLTIQDEFLTNTHTCGDSVSFMFNMRYIACTNGASDVRIGFSWISNKDAEAQLQKASASDLKREVSEGVFWTSPSNHNFYYFISNYVRKTMPPIPSTSHFLYAHLKQINNGLTEYAIPVQTSCAPDATVCSCSFINKKRTETCYQNGAQISSTENSPSCALQASCSYSISSDGKYAIFDTVAINGINTIKYKDRDTNGAISKIYKRKLMGTSTIVHNVAITDSYDKSTAYASCSTAGTPAVITATTTEGDPSIISFRADTPVVNKNSNCIYNWNVENVDQCSLQVNNTSVLLQGDGTSGPISVSTANGLNQRAVITCVANGTPAVGATPAVPPTTLSTSTLCQVLPEVIER